MRQHYIRRHQHTRLLTVAGIIVGLGLVAATMSVAKRHDKPAGASFAAAAAGSPHHGKAARRHHVRKEAAHVDVQAAVKILRRINPRLADQIQRLNARNPKRARQTLRHHYRWVAWLLRMQKHDPKMFELRLQDIIYTREVNNLAHRLRRPWAGAHAGAHTKAHTQAHRGAKVHGENLQAHADRPQPHRKAQVDAGGAHHAAGSKTIDEAQRAGLRKRLRSLVEKQFDIRQQIRQHELGNLEQQIRRVHDQLKSRAGRKDKLIDQRMRQLLHRGFAHKRKHKPGSTAPAKAQHTKHASPTGAAHAVGGAERN